MPNARSKNCIYYRYIYIAHAKFDYSNSPFLDIDITQINRLQTIQNVLARAVTKPPKHDRSTPVLKILHWLEIPDRILSFPFMETCLIINVSKQMIRKRCCCDSVQMTRSYSGASSACIVRCINASWSK